MRKANKIMMIMVSVLLSAVLLTTSALSGTLAKYTTKGGAYSDGARVAKWGITVEAANDLGKQYIEEGDDYFKVQVNTELGDDYMLAPGTRGALAWFSVEGTPEVMYSIDFTGSIEIGDGYKASSLFLHDENGTPTDYFPIALYLYRYDLDSNNVRTTKTEIKHCVTRTVDTKDGTELTLSLFDANQSSDVATLQNTLNGNGEYSFNALDSLGNAPGTSVKSIYVVEWCWAYDATSDLKGKVDASASQTHTYANDEQITFTYQTADLDTQLTEAIAKTKRNSKIEDDNLFDIKLDMSVSVNQIEISEGGTTTPDSGTTTPDDETTTPVTPPKLNYVEINWKDLYEAGLMRSQWWTDIGQSQNDYDSKFTVTATDTELISVPNDEGAERSYFSTKMYEITSDTSYEYTFEAKNYRAGGYAGVIFAYDINEHFPYFAFGEFDNKSTVPDENHICYRKGHYDAEGYPSCVVNEDVVSEVVKETNGGYGQYKVIYEGLNVTFWYLNTSGEYEQLGSTITLPAGSKVCVGVFSLPGSIAENNNCTVSLRNCVLTAKNDATVDYLVGENISLVKEFTIKVATFNIRKAYYESPQYQNYDRIVAAIKASGADIIFLQEVDYQTVRSGKLDQVALIAEQAGYKYYWNFKAFDFDGGHYGVAIISKYELGNPGITYLSSGTGEQRILARIGIRVNNEVIQFFITQLSYNGEDGVNQDVRAQQFAEVAEVIAGYDKVILGGDFNTDTWTDFDPIVDKGFLLVNKPDDYMGTCDTGAALDNIVHSKIFTSSDRNVIDNGASDHYLLYATLTYRE